jgi:hypothetical protein
MEATYKDQESKTYFIQNNSARDHNFTIDHIIRKDWKRLDSAGKDQVGPEMYQFKLEVKSKNTAKQEVLEEHVFADKTMVVANLDDAVLRQFIAHKAPAANVKNALQQVLDKQTALKQLKFELGENKLALKLVSDDQARVRENLRIIPQSSEHYKDFLKKFVAQETQIEEAQRTIRAQEALLQKTQKEYDAFVSALTVQ